MCKEDWIRSRGRYLTINVYFFLDEVYFVLNFARCGQHSAWCSWHTIGLKLAYQLSKEHSATNMVKLTLHGVDTLTAFSSSNSLCFQLFKGQKIFFSKKDLGVGKITFHFYFFLLKASLIQRQECIERQRAWKYRLLLTCLEKDKT